MHPSHPTPPQWEPPPHPTGVRHPTQRTARRIAAGTWVCALIVMVTSAGNSVLTFGALGGNRAVGLGVGVAVDVALCVGLIGDRLLAKYGMRSGWGRALRITAGVMSLVLSVGASLIIDNYFLAVLLGFLPTLLWLLTEYGQNVVLLFAELHPPVPTGEHPTPVVAPHPTSPADPSHPSTPPHPVVITPPRGVEGLPGWAKTWHAVHGGPAPTPPSASKALGDVTPELLDRVRRWRDERIKNELPVGRRPLAAELGSETLARKVQAALAGAQR